MNNTPASGDHDHRGSRDILRLLEQLQEGTPNPFRHAQARHIFETTLVDGSSPTGHVNTPVHHHDLDNAFTTQQTTALLDSMASIDPNLIANGAHGSHHSSPNSTNPQLEPLRQVLSEPTSSGRGVNDSFILRRRHQEASMHADGHSTPERNPNNRGYAVQQTPQFGHAVLSPESSRSLFDQHSPNFQPHSLSSEQYSISHENLDHLFNDISDPYQQQTAINDLDLINYFSEFPNGFHENIAYHHNTVSTYPSIKKTSVTLMLMGVNLHSKQQSDFDPAYHHGSSSINPLSIFTDPSEVLNHTSPITPATAQSNETRDGEGVGAVRQQGEKAKCAEVPCTRGARPGGRYCKRHQEKWNRNNAAPPRIPYLPEWNFTRAMNVLVYPQYPRKVSDQVLAQHAALEDQWVQRFLLALMNPVQEDDPNIDQFYKDQQKKFNGTALMEKENNGRYAPKWINARMRMLFRSALILHCGGRAVYPIGGDNGGYGKPDLNMTFDQRLAQLENVLTKNKLIAGDVIEGRGVMALVENPEKYEKRKSQNKQSNLKKDEVLEAERKRLRDAAEGEDEVDGQEYEDDAYEPTSPQATSSSKRSKASSATSRVTRARTSKRLKSEAIAESTDQQLSGPSTLASSPDLAHNSAIHDSQAAATAAAASSIGDFADALNMSGWADHFDGSPYDYKDPPDSWP